MSHATDLLGRALSQVLASSSSVSRPGQERDVRVIDDAGMIWAADATDGQWLLTATSLRHKDEWGTAQERHWSVDPADWPAVLSAVRDAVASLA